MEFSIEVSKIESLMPEQKALYRTLIETTVSLVDSSNKSRPELPNLSKAVLGGADLIKKAWNTMITNQVIDLWKGIGTPSSADSFEKIINSPSKKLAGFNLRGGQYPIFSPDSLKDKELLVLGESEVKQIYIVLGGSGEKAEQMFPAPPEK